MAVELVSNNYVYDDGDKRWFRTISHINDFWLLILLFSYFERFRNVQIFINVQFEAEKKMISNKSMGLVLWIIKILFFILKKVNRSED